MTESFAVDAARLTRHLEVLTERIGVRLAGSTGEQAAVEYIADEFEMAGALTTIETFPIMTRNVSDQSLEVRAGGAWRNFPCSLSSVPRA